MHLPTTTSFVERHGKRLPLRLRRRVERSWTLEVTQVRVYWKQSHLSCLLKCSYPCSGLRVVGATSTGTHGSGLTIPPLAGMIRGVDLVSAKFGADGKPIIYRIEPTGGITDPNRHSGPVVLLQDDKTFNAVIVGLCAFGVIYSVTIETLPFYWVQETREFTDWSTAKKLLEQGSSGSILKCHNSEIWLNPYTKQALISRREVTTSPKNDGNNSVSAFATLINLLPALKSVLNNIEKKPQTQNADIIRGLGYILANILQKFPLLIPVVSIHNVPVELILTSCTTGSQCCIREPESR